MKKSFKYFVIIYTPGDNWIKGQPVYNQPLNEHAYYMQTLLNRGILIMGGPFDKEPGGLALIRVKSTKEGKEIFDNDPAIQKKILKGSVIDWNSSFNSLN